MDYTALTAKELQELCRAHDLPTARDKATMIARLQEADAAPVDAPDAVLPAVEPEPAPSAPETAAEPVEEDSEALDYWVVDGGFSQRYDRHGKLDDREHRHNLTVVREAAEATGFTPYGPPFRVTDSDTQTWVYRVNVR